MNLLMFAMICVPKYRSSGGSVERAQFEKVALRMRLLVQDINLLIEKWNLRSRCERS